MDKRSRTMAYIVVFLTVISIYMLYRRSYITQDFEIVEEEEVVSYISE